MKDPPPPPFSFALPEQIISKVRGEHSPTRAAAQAARPFRNKSRRARSFLLNCTSTCGLWIQAAYVYTVSPPFQTSLIYLQKPANLGHPTSPSPLILMRADTVCTVENSAEGIRTAASRLFLFITLLVVLCFGRRINKATLMQIRLGHDADSELH